MIDNRSNEAVVIFDNDGRLVKNILHEMRATGNFLSPHAAGWDAKGNVDVVERIPDGRVTKLRRV